MTLKDELKRMRFCFWVFFFFSVFLVPASTVGIGGMRGLDGDAGRENGLWEEQEQETKVVLV